MGRPKKVEAELLLEAAQHVVVDQGAAHLTLNAVANDAGVSKASVLYDYKSKDALIHALVTSKLDAAARKIDTARQALEGSEDAGIRARLAVANEFRPSVDDRAVAIAVISAMSGNAELREVGRAFYKAAIDDVVKTASSPRGALLAFLAMEGIQRLDYLGLVQWTQEEFDTLLRDIEWLCSQTPAVPARPEDRESGPDAEPPPSMRS